MHNILKEYSLYVATSKMRRLIAKNADHGIQCCASILSDTYCSLKADVTDYLLLDALADRLDCCMDLYQVNLKSLIYLQ